MSVFDTVTALVDRTVEPVSRVANVLAAGCLFALTVATLYEVVARYVFTAPTLWAFDVAYMLNGAGFCLAAGYTLRRGEHVAIDVFVARLPTRMHQRLLSAMLLLVALPSLGLVAGYAISEAWEAFQTGEIESVSAWQPRIWPFRTALAVGITVLTLEVGIAGLRLLRGGDNNRSTAG